ncbi:hypothetical protein WR25_17530 [Diploscapter pachys]|uniref:Uncharacterized protein n=1 Tax=Diploscapter pachys TaxID=2018661 RepID=A0A2A2KCS8_9BILA|nr:hypothetical protein WR25_17530 [Diploscapter pachys]
MVITQVDKLQQTATVQLRRHRLQIRASHVQFAQAAQRIQLQSNCSQGVVVQIEDAQACEIAKGGNPRCGHADLVASQPEVGQMRQMHQFGRHLGQAIVTQVQPAQLRKTAQEGGGNMFQRQVTEYQFSHVGEVGVDRELGKTA